MGIEDEVSGGVVVRFSESTAGVVNNRPVTTFADIAQQPANECRFPHPDGAVNQEVHHFSPLHHVQLTHPQVGQFTVLTQHPVDLSRLVGQLHTGDVLVFTLLLPDTGDIPGQRHKDTETENTAGHRRPLQPGSQLLPHRIHVRVGKYLGQGHLQRVSDLRRGVVVVHVVEFAVVHGHQRNKALVHVRVPVQAAVIQHILRDIPEKNHRGQRDKQNEYPEANPVVHLKEHAPAIGGHLPALGEVLTCKAHSFCPIVIAPPGVKAV